MNQWKNLSTE